MITTFLCCARCPRSLRSASLSPLDTVIPSLISEDRGAIKPLITQRMYERHRQAEAVGSLAQLSMRESERKEMWCT